MIWALTAWRFIRANRDFILPALAGIGILLAVWLIYANGKATGRAKERAAWESRMSEAQQVADALSEALRADMAVSDARITEALAGITVTNTTINRRIERETIVEPRYNSPDCAVSAELHQSVANQFGTYSAAAASLGDAAVPGSGVR